MGRGLAIASCLLLALAAPSAHAKPPRTPAQKRCATRGTTVAENARARVYRVFTGDSEFYACLTRTGRTRHLAGSGGGAAHYTGGFFRLIGTRVGYVQQFCLDVDCTFEARTIDLARGRTIHRRTRVDGLAVGFEISRSGSFAFVSQPAYPSASYTIEAVDADGRRTLDSGPEIDSRSLAVGGGRVYWMHGGEPRSAELRQ